MSKNAHGLTCLNAKGTQFDDLPGIICFNISNLLNENGTDYIPYQEKVISAAQAATRTELKGSDGPNLLTQARAILHRVSIASHMADGGQFDLVDIVTRQYPKKVMLRQKHSGTDPDAIYRHMEIVMSAFQRNGAFYGDEVFEMVQTFEHELRGLHLSEMMIHSDVFKIDSILIGLGKMSFAEKLLRRRINSYMEDQLTRIIRRNSKSMSDVHHVETLSLPLEIGERVAACHRFHNKYGYGAVSGVCTAASSTAGVTFYNSQWNNFTQTISGFYEQYVK